MIVQVAIAITLATLLWFLGQGWIDPAVPAIGGLAFFIYLIILALEWIFGVAGRPIRNPPG